MLKRLAPNAAPIATQFAELATAVPQVIAYRMSRMAFAGVVPSLRDRKEFELMSAEKTEAFMESWSAMSTHAFQLSQELTLSLFSAFWFPWAQGRDMTNSPAMQLGNAALSIMQTGMEPVHRRATANAARLGRAAK